MPEYRSPLTGHDAPRRLGDGTGESAVRLRGRRPASLVQIAGWTGFEARAAKFLRPLGFADAGDYRSCRRAGAQTLFRIAPDRVWLMGADPHTVLAIAAETSDLVALDLSHARHEIAVSGSLVRDLLARLCTIDLRDAALPVDGFAQTGTHGIPMLILREASEAYRCLVPTTWALGVWDLFCLNAAPFGYEILQSETEAVRPADRPARPSEGQQQQRRRDYA